MLRIKNVRIKNVTVVVWYQTNHLLPVIKKTTITSTKFLKLKLGIEEDGKQSSTETEKFTRFRVWAGLVHKPVEFSKGVLYNEEYGTMFADQHKWCC